METTTEPPFTQTEIVIRGRPYKVTRAASTRVGETPFVYTLTGRRGASYRTTRNEPKPDMMFLLDNRGFGIPSVMDGVWLSDKDGSLKVVSS